MYFFSENKGRVEFTEVPEGVDVKMTISYKLPSIVAFLFRYTHENR